jgi:co-chaperonin GroES (HSP10)|tara:strand:+ start:177 stop:434 length:258 start_codon:yes stop_codon:yes gene_type:complete
MQAIGTYIIIRPIDEEVTTKSGLLLSGEETSKMRYRKGEVLNVGTDVDMIKKKDIIYYDQQSGHTMLLDNEVVAIIRQMNVVVVL